MLGNYSFELSYGNIIFYPVRKKLVQLKEFYNLINRYDYKQKQYWKQMFFDAIEEEEIDEFFLLEFIGYIFSINNRFYFNDLDKYIKFNMQFQLSQSFLPPSALNHKNVITYITEILLLKSKHNDISFDRHICEKCSLYFKEKLDLLKQVFYLQKKKGVHYYNYEGKEMAAISTIDHYFLIEYLEEATKDMTYIDFKFDRLNLSYVWDFPEHEEILNKALEIIIAKAPIFSNFEHQANVLFKGMKLEPKQQEKAYQYISKFISNNFSSKQHIHIIMNIVTYSFNDQVIRFFKEFLLLNKDIEFIKDMWLERNEGIVGSRVPSIDSNINFTKKIIEMVKYLPNKLDYADHIKFWERGIEWAKKDKQHEMKRDFTGWFE